MWRVGGYSEQGQKHSKLVTIVVAHVRAGLVVGQTTVSAAVDSLL